MLSSLKHLLADQNFAVSFQILFTIRGGETKLNIPILIDYFAAEVIVAGD